MLHACQSGLGRELSPGLGVLMVVAQGLRKAWRVDVQGADGQRDVGGQATIQRQQQPLQRAALDRLQVADVDPNQRLPDSYAADMGRDLGGPHLPDRLPRDHGPRATSHDDDSRGG